MRYTEITPSRVPTLQEQRQRAGAVETDTFNDTSQLTAVKPCGCHTEDSGADKSRSH